MEKVKDVSITDIVNIAVESLLSHSYKINTVISKASEITIFNKYYLSINFYMKIIVEL